MCLRLSPSAHYACYQTLVLSTLAIFLHSIPPMTALFFPTALGDKHS